jgi:hypothetical protein
MRNRLFRYLLAVWQDHLQHKCERRDRKWREDHAVCAQVHFLEIGYQVVAILKKSARDGGAMARRREFC